MTTMLMLLGFSLLSCLAAAGLIASAQNQADADRLLEPLHARND